MNDFFDYCDTIISISRIDTQIDYMIMTQYHRSHRTRHIGLF